MLSTRRGTAGATPATGILRSVLLIVAALLLIAPASTAQWELDDIEELGCNNSFVCTFCYYGDPCNDPLASELAEDLAPGEIPCFTVTVGSAAECYEYEATLNNSGLGGGIVTPAKEYVHPITDWTSLAASPNGSACAQGIPGVAANPRTRPFVLEHVRMFRSRIWQYERSFGTRWQHNYDYQLDLNAGVDSITINVLFPGRVLPWQFIDVGFTGVYVPLNETVSTGATLQLLGDDYLLTWRTGEQFHFVPTVDDASAEFRPDWIEDRTGYRLSFTYDGETDGMDRLVQVSDSFGRALTYDWDLLWDTWHVVTSVGLPDGREILYAYTTLDDYTVTYPNGDVSNYGFLADVDGPYYAFADARGNEGSRKHHVYVTAGGQVRGIRNWDGTQLFVPRNLDANTIRYEYSTGLYETMSFTDDGYPTQMVQDDSGTTKSTVWDHALGLVLQSTDNLGQTTSWEYENGLPTQKTQPDGTVITYVWAGGYLGSITDELGRTTLYTYDADGNLLSITYPDGNVASFTYGPFGLVATWTDRRGNVTSFTWDANGYLASMTLPDDDTVVGNEPVWLYVHDLVGRLVETTDPEGRITAYAWDDGDRLVTTIYPDGTTAEMVYGVNGTDPADPAGTTGLVVARKDRNDVWTTFTYDALDNVLTETDPLATYVTNTWVPATRLLESTDREGDLTFLTYDATGLLQTRSLVVDATTSLTTTYAYDELDRVTQEDDPWGFDTITEYDWRGNVTWVARQVAPSVFAIEEFDYDAAGNRITATDAIGNVTTYEYDAMDRVVTMTDPLGAQRTYTYDANGNRLSMTDALGNTWSWLYTNRNKVVGESDPTGVAKVYAYFLDDQVASILDPFTGGRTKYTYSCCGRLISEMTWIDGGDGDILVTYDYDGNGNVVERTDGEGYVWTTAYDARNRVVAETDALGNTTSTVYVPDGSSLDPRLAAGQGELVQVTDPLGNTISTVLDALGRTLRVIDARGNADIASYDEVDLDGFVVLTNTDREGRLTAMLVDGLGRTIEQTDPLGRVTKWTYDLVGNLLSIEDTDGNVTAYAYDAANRKVSDTYADGGTWTYGYYLNGWLETRTDAKAVVKTYGYDGAGRLISVAYSEPGVLDDVFVYDLGGRLISATSGVYGYHVTRDYDVANRLILELQGTQAVAYAYERRSLVTGLTTPDGLLLTRAYTPRGELLSVESGGTTHALNAYDAAGRLVGRTFGNGTSLDVGYDPRNWVRKLTHELSGADIQTLHYDHDKVGNKLVQWNVSKPKFSETYAYDAADRLVAWEQKPLVTTRGDGITGTGGVKPLPGVGTTPGSSQTWDLDALDNWDETIIDGVSAGA